MRVIAIAVSALIAVTLFSAHGIAQSAKEQAFVADPNACRTMGRAFQKGGVVGVAPNVYVSVEQSKNGRNEIFLDFEVGKEQRWEGKKIAEPQVVIIFEGKVWSSQNVPDQFDLKKAVIVSFEKSNIEFYNFQLMCGGYHERMPR